MCAELQIVELSRSDTNGTKQAVAANNAVIDRECNAPKKP